MGCGMIGVVLGLSNSVLYEMPIRSVCHIATHCQKPPSHLLMVPPVSTEDLEVDDQLARAPKLTYCSHTG